jgi:hypothetical protein
VSYLLLLLLSVLLLIPSQSTRRLGMEIALLGVIALCWLVRFIMAVVRSAEHVGVTRVVWLRTFGISGTRDRGANRRSGIADALGVPRRLHALRPTPQLNVL